MRERVRNLVLVIVITVEIFFIGLTVGVAMAHVIKPASEPTLIPPRTGYAATVLCSGMAEDSAGHVRLVRYDPQPDGSITLVYRCMRKGY